jgi:hypothetical protein
VFEAWADVRARYPLDPGRVVVTGFSMGGCGTYKLGVQFPDLFSAIYPDAGCSAAEVWSGPPAQPVGGVASESYLMFASLRNVRVLSLNATQDQLVPRSQTQQNMQRLQDLGYRYDYWWFDTGHAEYRQWMPDVYAQLYAAATPTDPDPPHVSYVLNGFMSEPRYGLTADHAYWLSGLTLRNANVGPPLGTIDVRSDGFGVGDPPAGASQTSAGASHDGSPRWDRQLRIWGPAPARPIADRLHITATNVATMTVDPVRARVSCGATLDITSDGPIHVILAGCP